MNNNNRTLPYFALLLALGANTLIVELVIPRMIAPVFGNTLFSWTAIITVVLVALTAGYRVGGILATRKKMNGYILVFSLGAAIWGLLLGLFGDVIVPYMRPFNMMFGPLIAATILAALPAFLDAAVVPMVIQAIEGERGDVSGRCFAWSTIGSILGVVFTGYVLLPQLGISGALLTGVVLITLAMIPMRWYLPASCLAILCIGAIVFTTQQIPKSLVDLSNGYHRIQVKETGSVRSLYLDTTLEGQVRTGNPRPVAQYMTRVVDMIETNLINTEHPVTSAFFLGGGSFSMPGYLKHINPEMRVVVAEVDPDVVQIGTKYLELNKDIEVIIGDGRNVLADDSSRYDVIVNDAFHGVRKIPFHLASREFNQLVSNRLSSKGVYIINVRGHPSQSHMASSFVKTLSDVFPYLYAKTETRTNISVIASKQQIDWADEIKEIGPMAITLTDNHAPIEYLIARDFVDEKLRRMRN
ncbi:MAG: spermidine synthase [marine bacterium B5-7]|nr:MAG: spermidine synthase [marine bacterium B5-7]